ncbi:MAG TPA: HDOD domain-containing protein [Bryobacteraceae bacterium]|nr:HDOD domain-containing protein [Bryobacteraceae bacterium]
MDVFVARQAIFDRRLEVFGYELLFRSCRNNAYDGVDGDLASSQVISSSFYSIGIENILGGKRAFINFPRKLLVEDCASLLPREVAVIEILEGVEGDEEVLEACAALRRRGYLLALDDFADGKKASPLTQLADIIKVDFRVTEPAKQEELVRRYGRRGIRMLAEKVETQAEFERARKMGYSYFQGYFFARPMIVHGREIPGFKLNYLRILREVHQPELDYKRLEELLKPEVSLTYKLLRYVNSAVFGFNRRIESIKEALVLVGENEIRKWVSVVVLPQMAGNKPGELVVTAAVRARFCELMAKPAGLESREQELFLMGLFSLLDVMMDQPMEALLDQLNTADDIRAALLESAPEGDRVASVYALMRANEQADWDKLAAIARQLAIPVERIPEIYMEAVQWGGPHIQDVASPRKGTTNPLTHEPAYCSPQTAGRRWRCAGGKCQTCPGVRRACRCAEWR